MSPEELFDMFIFYVTSIRIHGIWIRAMPIKIALVVIIIIIA